MKEIISYIKILIDVIPSNIPPKLKNGKCSIKKLATISFKTKETTNIAIVPIKETPVLITPRLNPKATYNNTINIITTLIIFIFSTLLILIIL